MGSRYSDMSLVGTRKYRMIQLTNPYVALSCLKSYKKSLCDFQATKVLQGFVMLFSRG